MEPNVNLTTPLEADQPEEVKPSAPTPRRAGRTAAASPAASAVGDVKPGVAVPKVEEKPPGLTDGLTSYYAFDESAGKPVEKGSARAQAKADSKPAMGSTERMKITPSGVEPSKGK